MKKLILTIITFTVLISCSKDEDTTNTEYDVAVSPPNLYGVWYNRQIINSDGSVVNHVNACTSMRDNLNLKSNFTADFHSYLANCTDDGDLNVGYTFLISLTGGTSYISFGSSTGNHEISKLTNRTLHLEYDFVNGTGATTRITSVYSKE